MTREWLAPWRWLTLALGVAIPVTGGVMIVLFAEPGVLKWDPPDPAVAAARYREALDTMTRGDLDAARSQLETLRDGDPFNALFHATLGDLHRRAGRIPEAIAATRMAVQIDPTFGEAYYNLACLEVQGGHTDEAITDLRRAVRSELDVRAIIGDDSDLAPLLRDPRLMIYLEGARNVPLGNREASIRFSPKLSVVGEPLEVAIEIVSIYPSDLRHAPAISVEYTGTDTLSWLVPLGVDVDDAVHRDEDGSRFRWTFRYRFRPGTAYSGMLGDWEVQVDGVRIPVDVSRLVIEPARTPLGYFDDRSGGVRSGFHAERLFKRPAAPLQRGQGPRAVDLGGEGPWKLRTILLQIDDIDEAHLAGLRVSFSALPEPIAWYDEVIRRFDEGRRISSLRRYYAVPGAASVDLSRARAMVEMNEQRYLLPIEAKKRHSAPGRRRNE